MKILITGIYGNVGTEIAAELMKDHHIIGVGRKETSTGCHAYYQVDLAKAEEVEEIIKNNRDLDMIIHCAALAHNKGNDLSHEAFKQANTVTTKNLVDLSNKYLQLKAFLFLSTISVYGENLQQDVYTEEDSCHPESPYAITKRSAEKYILLHTSQHPYYILRLSPVYSKTFTLNIQRRTEMKDRPYLIGKGNNKLSLCHVQNVVHVVSTIINGHVKENEIYNIADSKTYQFNEIAKPNSKIRIPKIALKTLHHLNKITLKSQFIHENTIKLISDNIYSTAKIQQYTDLPYDLESDA